MALVTDPSGAVLALPGFMVEIELEAHCSH